MCVCVCDNAELLYLPMFLSFVDIVCPICTSLSHVESEIK